MWVVKQGLLGKRDNVQRIGGGKHVTWEETRGFSLCGNFKGWEVWEGQNVLKPRRNTTGWVQNEWETHVRKRMRSDPKWSEKEPQRATNCSDRLLVIQTLKVKCPPGILLWLTVYCKVPHRGMKPVASTLKTWIFNGCLIQSFYIFIIKYSGILPNLQDSFLTI